MSDLFYRFKFKSDLFELELESTDAEFIDRKIMQLIELSTRPLEDGPRLLSAGPSERTEPSTDETPIEEAMQDEEEEEEVTPPPSQTQKRKRRKRKTVSKPKKSKTAAKKKEAPGKDAGMNANAVADAVKSSDHFKTIQDKVLKKSNQLNRILLSFYFAEQLYDKKGLTTGDVESITESLGAGIKSTNVSSQLKKHSQLFNSRGERKRGSVVYYTLNKDGKERFENLLQSGK